MSSQIVELEKDLLQQRSDLLRANSDLSLDEIGFSLSRGDGCVRVDMHGPGEGQFHNYGYTPQDYGCEKENQLSTMISTVLRQNGVPELKQSTSDKGFF